MKPNFLFIMTDQHSAHALGSQGNKVVETPNIDRLAREGVRFSNCYTPSPICGPARWALMTGLYPHNHRGWDNGSSLSSEMPTFAHMLTRAGYETVICSRMHFNGTDQYHGYEKRLATEHNNPIHYSAEGAGLTGTLEPVFSGERAPEYSGDYPINDSPRATHDDWVLSKNIEYLRSHDWGDRPFMLTASFLAPHPSVKRRKEYLELFHKYLDMDLGAKAIIEERFNQLHPHTKRLISAGKEEAFVQSSEEKHRFLAEYYSRVTYFDRQVGKLLDTLEEEGLRDNTVIVYASDHGDDMGRFGYWGKTSFYDNVSKVPLIISLPPGMRSAGMENSVRENNVSLLDLFPTFAELSGAEPLPYNIDGRSLVPLLNGDDREWDNTIFSEYYGQFARHAMFMVKHNSIKFNYYVDEQPELFNLENDPDELTDLAGDPAHSQLRKKMEQKLRNICDPEKLQGEYEQSRRQRAFIAQTTHASIQTKERINNHIRDYRAKWDEPNWDDNQEQSKYEWHLR